MIRGQTAHPRSTELECGPLGRAAGEERAQTTAGVGGKVETGTLDSSFPRLLGGGNCVVNAAAPDLGESTGSAQLSAWAHLIHTWQVVALPWAQGC